MHINKIAALKALGLSQDIIDQLLDDVLKTEKAAEALGVRYKEQPMRPSEEAEILDRACAAAGWDLDRDAGPIYDHWVTYGLAPALGLVARVKEAGMTPITYTSDPIARAFAGQPSGDWRPR